MCIRDTHATIAPNRLFIPRSSTAGTAGMAVPAVTLMVVFQTQPVSAAVGDALDFSKLGI